MKLENRIFDGIEYTLVDCYHWKEKEYIYHFAGDQSDLFCIKNEEGYIPIRDEKLINDIIEYYSLKEPEIYFLKELPANILRLIGVKKIRKVTPNLRSKIIEEQIKKLSELECGVEKKELEERLKFVDIYKADLDSMHANGMYHPMTNDIFLKQDYIVNKDIKSKRVRLHETVHAITGSIALLKKYHNKQGLLEGATENIVEKLYGNKTSSGNNKIKFNFSYNTAYPFQVALIRMMEYAIQMECDESILRGDTKFFKKFAEKYGADILRFIRHRANRLLNIDKIKNYVEYFKETQDAILEGIFNKDFNEIEHLEEAKEYLKKLQGFEMVRGKIRGDTTFKEFYEDKLQSIKKKFIEKGFSEDYLQSYLKENEYKESEFYPLLTEKRQYEYNQKFLLDRIAKKIEKPRDVEEEIKQFKVFLARKGKIQYLLLTMAGEPLIMTVGEPGDIMEWYMKKKQEFKLPADVSQESDSFYINISDTEKILLEEIPLTQNLELFKERLKKRIEKNRVHVQQKNSIRKVANRQTLSKVNRMTEKIKANFQRSTVEIKGANSDKKGEKVEKIIGIWRC